MSTLTTFWTVQDDQDSIQDSQDSHQDSQNNHQDSQDNQDLNGFLGISGIISDFRVFRDFTGFTDILRDCIGFYGI